MQTPAAVSFAALEFAMNYIAQGFILIGFGLLAMLGAHSTGAGALPGTFDYAAATPQERAAYLESVARSLKNTFRPNFLAKKNAPTIGGRSVSLTYGLHTNKLDCDGDDPCKVLQCRRYLNSSVSTNNISVKLRYEDGDGRKVGSQLLKNSTCAQIVKTAKTG